MQSRPLRRSDGEGGDAVTVAELASALGAEVLNKGDMSREVTGVYVCDLIGRAAARMRRGDAWITIMTNRNVAAAAEIAGAACVLMADGVSPDAELARDMERTGAAFLRCGGSAYTLAHTLRRLTGLE